MPLTFAPTRPAHTDAGFSFAAIPPSVGAAQRTGIERGLAAVLVLVVSCLMMIYAPLAWHGPASLDTARTMGPLPREGAIPRVLPGVAHLRR